MVHFRKTYLTFDPGCSTRKTFPPQKQTNTEPIHQLPVLLQQTMMQLWLSRIDTGRLTAPWREVEAQSPPPWQPRVTPLIRRHAAPMQIKTQISVCLSVWLSRINAVQRTVWTERDDERQKKQNKKRWRSVETEAQPHSEHRQCRMCQQKRGRRVWKNADHCSSLLFGSSALRGCRVHHRISHFSCISSLENLQFACI